MEDKNKKILLVAIWGFTMLIVILVSFIFRPLPNESSQNGTDLTTESEEDTASEIIVYDGSENNPNIPGVQ